ncbi:uncharacterized protein LOC127915062 isoform X2 [Oncorhynchus keta]|uniref:uncharacterized protein LOC127915062 isoform X2 n=1 Tax=Oncorhynchus keta TaxID=8018 RepID=UPI00227CA5C7|nr:uncharacterized protein LOC127915062 isoform X2 [Oncorhynchus keta]
MEDDEMEEAPLDLGPPEIIMNLTEVTTEDLVEQDLAVETNGERNREEQRHTRRHRRYQPPDPLNSFQQRLLQAVERDAAQPDAHRKEDEETLFAMSLVPTLKRLPQQRKVAVKRWSPFSRPAHRKDRKRRGVAGADQLTGRTGRGEELPGPTSPQEGQEEERSCRGRPSHRKDRKMRGVAGADQLTGRTGRGEELPGPTSSQEGQEEERSCRGRPAHRKDRKRRGVAGADQLTGRTGRGEELPGPTSSQEGQEEELSGCCFDLPHCTFLFTHVSSV